MRVAAYLGHAALTPSQEKNWAVMYAGADFHALRPQLRNSDDGPSSLQ